MGNFIERNEDGTYLAFTTLKAQDKDSLWQASEILAKGGPDKDKALSESIIVIDPLFYTTNMLEIMEMAQVSVYSRFSKMKMVFIKMDQMVILSKLTSTL